MPWYTVRGQELRIRVRVLPRAKSCGLALLADGRLKLRLTAAPADGRANKQAAEILAGLFAVPKSQISLTSGASSRDKTFTVTGVTDLTGLPAPDALPGNFDSL